ncbi:hypothetical protein Agub_g15523 [Astrephomene gubernaculifera]|uniref:7,8-dihydroneopterin aldolase n=1 Tax=Astrephomene gubernaculifera TaxID=47775 RepID=A0AAD3E370_9CHLO|nr:hypothetical protein Agub_g15523 [Astrephomene gubernaculifera]
MTTQMVSAAARIRPHLSLARIAFSSPGSLPLYVRELGTPSTAVYSCNCPSLRFYQNNSSAVPGGDWIHLNGMRFHGRHGVLTEETRLGQTFVVDVRLQVDTERAGVSDELEDTVNYAAVYGSIRGVVEGPPCKLLEAVAHRACNLVLADHAAVREMVLSIRKLSIPGVPSLVDSVVLFILSSLPALAVSSTGGLVTSWW